MTHSPGNPSPENVIERTRCRENIGDGAVRQSPGLSRAPEQCNIESTSVGVWTHSCYQTVAAECYDPGNLNNTLLTTGPTAATLSTLGGSADYDVCVTRARTAAIRASRRLLSVY